MRKTQVVACFSLLFAVATIITQAPNSIPIPHSLIATPTNQVSQASKQHLVETYGRLPLSFEANHGQTDGSVQFLSRGNGYTLFLTANEAVLSLRKSTPHLSEPRPTGSGGLNPTHASQSRDLEGAGNPPLSPNVIPRSVSDEGSALSSQSVPSAKSADDVVLHMKLLGANPNSAVSGHDELPGKSNYFLGSDPSKWRTNVPTYAKVRYEDVYPGIDLVYYGNQRQLEYDLVVAPGADPRAIRLAFQSIGSHGTSFVPWASYGSDSLSRAKPRDEGAGAVPLRIDDQGDLILETDDARALRLHKPLIYQESDGVRQEIAGNYLLQNDGEVSFALAAYDARKTLIIDPVLSYSTYLGGNANDEPFGMAVDATGNVYVTGFTTSSNFPTRNPLQPSRNGPQDVYISKYDPFGVLVYSTFLGGNGVDTGFAVFVNAAGNAYLTGATESPDFPTRNPYQAIYGGGTDAYLVKLNPAGNVLEFSTFLGGNAREIGRALAVDSAGLVYTIGDTISPNFPIVNGFKTQITQPVTDQAYLAKFNSTGSTLLYSTYIGGSLGSQDGAAIALDSAANAYITGTTTSNDHPITLGVFQPAPGSTNFAGDAFVTKVNTSATGAASLVFSTYLGGSALDYANGIGVDSSRNVYVSGVTASANFPIRNGYDTTQNGLRDIFVAKLNPTASELLYSTFLGGSVEDVSTVLPSALAVAGPENVWVVTATTSPDMPTVSALQNALGGASDGFVANLNTAASGAASLVFSSYLGGAAADGALGIGLDASGNAYIVGTTSSSNFPTVNPAQQAAGGGSDTFVLRLAAAPRVNPGGVVNAAGYNLAATSVAPGSIAVVFGTSLTDGSSCVPPSCNQTFEGGRLKNTMAGATVTVNGVPAPIFYALPLQLAIQIPVELTGSSAAITVAVGGQSSTPQNILLEPVAPGIFTFNASGQGAGAIAHADGTPVNPANPAHPNEVVIVYATGLGQTTPSVPTGALPSGLTETVTKPTVTIDGIAAELQYWGLSGCCVGLNQINMKIPAATRTGNDVPLLLTIGGKQANPVTIAVAP